MAAGGVLPCSRDEMGTLMRLMYRMFDHGLAAEASCLQCGWRLTTSDHDLMDALRLDAQDHELECPARMSTFVDID